MEPKNVVLLGFVNRAIEYLNEHLDEDAAASLAKLKEIDLDTAKKELDEELNTSLEPLRSTIDALMNSGSEAFDKFVNADKREEDLSGEFDRIFDVDLDEDESVQDKGELEDLLSYYDLDGELEVDEKALDEEETEPEEKEEEIPASFEENTEEEVPFELDEEEEKLLQLIARNVNKKEDEQSEDTVSGANHELDSIFSELVAAEDGSEKQKEEIPIAINHIQELMQIPEEERVNIIENPLVDAAFDNKAEEIVQEEIKEEVKEEPEIPVEEEKPEPVYPEQVDKDDIIRLVKEIQPVSDVYYENIEQVIDERKAPVTEEKKADGQYVSSLIDDLKNKLDEEEEKKRAIEENYRQIYEKIHGTYPYLSNAFIRNVYDLKESIAKEYPLDVKIVILHRSHFNDVENLRQYVEIALKHDYTINADEKQMIVDAFKPYINTDGKIITSIFEVANQSALLEGEYEGYRVLFEDDLEYKA